MSNNSTIASVLAFILMLLLMSCGSKLFDKRINEGIIEYDISYPDIDPNHHMADFLPDQMIMEFQHNRFITTIEAGFGMFETKFIVDNKEHSFKQMLKLMNKKYATILSEKDVHAHNEVYPDYYIIYMDDTKEIAGYICNKALVIFDDVKVPSFYAYYTKDIHLDDPNWSNPYKVIDGVLLEYMVRQYDVLMKFSATSVSEADIDSDDFDLSEEYERVTPGEMDEQMKEIFATIK